MNHILRLPLSPSPEQLANLCNLQALFSQACNAVSGYVQTSRCWNRVALHHLCYRQVREQFPHLGAQMACNAIYSVCRAARWAYQHPGSPITPFVNSGKPLPRLLFLASSPVYFDRHTMSIKGNELSMFTLDGRLHFRLELAPAARELFFRDKLKEIALVQIPRFGPAKSFELVCWFVADPLHVSAAITNVTAVTTDYASQLCPETLAVGRLDEQPAYLETQEA